MDERIILTHYFVDDNDIASINQIKTTIEITKEKEKITYYYTKEDTYPNIEEKVIEKEIDNNIYNSILEINLSELNDNYMDEKDPTSWEIEISNKNIKGSYTLLPFEIFQIMKLTNFKEKILLKEDE